jgi:hypothetical protein
MDKIESFPVACSGGLVTNVSPIEQAVQQPGSARELINFESSLKGGYRRIKGYRKLNSSPVPRYATLLVKQAFSSGATSIVVSDPFFQLESNMTFRIAGQATDYTVTSRSRYTEGRSATVNFSPALSANVADKAVVTITGYTGIGSSYAQATKFFPVISAEPPRCYVRPDEGYQVFLSNALDPYSANAFGAVPYHNGTTLVNGAGQTGTTLIVDGLAFKPSVGDTFYISGVTDVYSVLSATDLTGTQSTLTLAQSLTSSPSDDASITWYHSGEAKNFSGIGRRTTYTTYFTDSIQNIVFATGEYPIVIEPLKGYRILTSNSDLDGCDHCAYYRNHLFLAKNNKVFFSVPYDVYSYDTALGAGVLSFDGTVTGLKAFRDQLIIFTTEKIYRLSGNSVADFRQDPITENVGCNNAFSIQEVGGDLVFQTKDGIRYLAATEKFGDFNLASLTETIQDKIETLLSTATTSFTTNSLQTSVTINEKAQYRIFRYDADSTEAASLGLIGTLKRQGQIEWSETLGLSVWATDYNYGFQGLNFTGEGRVDSLVVFCNGYDPYVYQMEYGNTFDGDNIVATYSTPFFVFNDPQKRKTLYNLSVSTEKNANIAFTASVLLNFNESDVIQPSSISMGNTSGILGDNIGSYFETTLIGNGNNASIKFVSNTANTDFSFKDFTIEYATNDRR